MRPGLAQKNDCVMVVVDIQERLFPRVWNRDEVLQRMEDSINAAKIFNLPIIVTEQNPSGLGPTVQTIQDRLPLYTPISKLEFSCMRNLDFVNKLSTLQRRTLVLLGIETHICVLQTALDGLQQGFDVLVLADAISSQNPFDHHTALERLGRAGAKVTTVQSMIYELLESAGNPEFLDIINLVKGMGLGKDGQLSDYA